MSRKTKKRAEVQASASPVEPGSRVIQKDWLFALAVSFAALFVYGLTLSRFVPGGDSGELIVVAANLSVAHPPGYPLYTMLAHLMTWLPWGSVAFRINLFSALCIAVFGAWCFLLLRRMGVRSLVAAPVCALALFSPLIWRYAIVAEVFALHLLLCVVLCDLFVRFVKEGREIFGIGFAFVVGLGASHHHTLVFLALPLFVCAWLSRPEFFRSPRFWIKGVLVFGLGLLPHLYLIWKAHQWALVSWGDLTTWNGFGDHVLRREYGTFQLVSGEEKGHFFRSLWFYVIELGKNSLWWGLPVLAWALWQSVVVKGKKTDDGRRAFAVSFLLILIGFHLLSNADLGNRLHYDVHTRFWLMPNFLAFLLMALALEKLSGQSEQWRKGIAALLMVSVVVQVAWHYRQEDQSQNDLFERTARANMESLPEGALYLVRGDIHVNASRYLQSVEGFRPDLRVLPLDLLWWPWMKQVVERHIPDVILPGKIYRDGGREPNSFHIKDLVSANIHRRAIFLGRIKPEEEALLKPDYELWDLGFVMRVLPRGQAMELSEFVERSRFFDELHMPEKTEFRDSSWEAFVYYNYWGRVRARGEGLYRRFGESPQGAEWLKVMAQQYENGLMKRPEEVRPLDLKLLSATYQKLTNFDESYRGKLSETYQRYLASEPQKSSKSR